MSCLGIPETFDDFFGYLKAPRIETPNVAPSNSGLASLVGLAILIRLPLIFVGKIASVPPQQPVFDFDLTQTASRGLSPLTVLVIAPIIEELIFRLPLLPSPLKLATPTALLLFFFLKPSSVALAVLVLMPTLVYFAIRWKEQAVVDLVSRCFPMLFYVSAFCFGLIHVRNFDPHSSESLIAAASTVLQHTVGGLLYGYVRVRKERVRKHVVPCPEQLSFRHAFLAPCRGLEFRRITERKANSEGSQSNAPVQMRVAAIDVDDLPRP